MIFFAKKKYFDNPLVDFKTKYSPDKIKINLANLRQLLIEVTDSCNLKCRYCGYGDLYDNFDKREANQQQFSNVKLLVDYLAELWGSAYNISYDKNIKIGFYGGEPLLNMRLIKEIIEYLKSLKGLNVHFSYNMTTNGVLLNKYMDFLVENKFSLLISLDGNESNSNYRVDKQNANSFHRVYKNVKLLQAEYSDYFDKNVNFNAVLHNKNSVEDVFLFVKNEFGKVPRIAELNTNGLSKIGKEELKQMFNSRYESFDMASDSFKLQDEFQYEDSASTFFLSFLRNFCGNYYTSYADLFDENTDSAYIPTGTCRPFERKLFLTVNGKILPCERMGQNHVLGTLIDGVLDLNYDKISTYYDSVYSKIVSSCKSCFLQKACGQCMFLLEEHNNKLVCPGYLPKNNSTNYFIKYISYAEEHPALYESLMNNISID